MVDFTPDPQVAARKEVLDIFEPKGDPIAFTPSGPPAKNINFKPLDAKKVDFTPVLGPAKKPNLIKAGLEGAYAPFKPIVEAVPKGVEASIKGGEQLVSGMAAPFLSQAQRDKLQKAGKYTPGESPVKEFSQAAYSGLMAPLAPAIESAGAALKAGAKAVGVPDKVTKAVGDLISTGLDVAGVAGIPGAKEGKAPVEGAKPAPEPQLPARAADELFKLSNRDEARRTEYVQNLKKIQGVPNETWEKLYAQKDNPAIETPVEIKYDNPGGNWLINQRAEAARRYENSGSKIGGAVTGYTGVFDFPAKALESIPGSVGEKRVANETRYEALLKKIKAEGFKRESPILVGVNFKGEPYIIEGNTRAAVARAMGVESIPAEVKYYAGGEQAKGPLSPDVLAALGKQKAGLERSPGEQQLYDSTIKQISDRSEALINELKGKGIDFSDVGGAPRRRKGMNPIVEKIYGEKPQTKGTGRKTISTFSPAAAPRSMFALPGKVGSRDIVYVGDDGILLKNGEPVGEITGKEKHGAAGVETSLGKLEQATTAEIEAQTKLQYHKNLLANEYLRVQSLERAKDASDFLDYLKKDPEFDQFATLAKSKETPANWRSIPDVRTFEGWKFDPRLAEVIEDYMGNIKSPEEYSRAVLNVAKAAKASIFMNPIMHMVNATNMFGVSKGYFGALRDLPSTPRALMRAMKSVLTQDTEYREAAKAGLSLPSMRQTAAEFNEQLTRAMGMAIRKEPRGMAQIAKDWGYTPVGMFKAYMRGASKLLWSYSDILAMTRVNEYMARGLSREEAIRRTEQVMANYRVPSRVAGSRALSQGLQNPVVTMFGRYDYNRFANLTGMIKRAISKDPQAWEARDQLLALAVMTTLGYTALDKWIQKESKSKGAHQGLGGYSQLVDVGKQLLEGRKSPAQAAQSTLAPGYLSIPIEALTGQNIYTGRPIAQRGDWNNFVQKPNVRDAARMGFDVGRYAADKFMPIADMDRLATSDMTATQFWLSQMGTQIPSEGQMAGRAKAAKYSRGEAKRANKKRPEWVR